MGPTVQYTTFSAQFLTDYSAAFNEVLILGQEISENIAAGKQAKAQYYKLRKLMNVLTALESPELTAKETEALEYCLVALTASAFHDGIEPVYLYIPPELDNDFLVGTGSDGGDRIGTGDYFADESNISE